MSDLLAHALHAKQRREAEMASLRMIMKINELSKEREHAMNEVSRVMAPVPRPTMGANILGPSSRVMNHRMPFLPETTRGSQLSPSLAPNLAPPGLANVLHQRLPLQMHPDATSAASLLDTRVPLQMLGARAPVETILRSEQTLPTKRGAPKSEADVIAEEILTNVREEKIQAALRSQHQRGKKRSDLNDMERLELTRSRNREHAKSTRLRKKARLNELVESERQLKPLLDSKNLREERVQCLCHFLSVRQDMLNSATIEETKNIADDTKACEKSLNEIIAFERSLKAVIVDPHELFRFDTGNSSNDRGFDSTFSSMRAWDQQFRSRTSESDANGTASSSPPSALFAYEIEDGIDGIGVSNNGAAYAQINLVSRKTNDSELSSSKTVLMTITVRARFDGPTSHRLSSVAWRILDDHCGFQKKSSSPLQALVVACSKSDTIEGKDQNAPNKEGDDESTRPWASVVTPIVQSPRGDHGNMSSTETKHAE